MRCGCVALVLVLGCVPAPAHDEDLPAETLIVVELAGELAIAHVYTAENRPASVVRAIGEDSTIYLLAYDRTPAELALAPAADGTLPLLPSSVSSRDAWPLPPADRWLAVNAEKVAGTGAVPALAHVRIARPSCPTIRVVTASITAENGVLYRLESSMALPFGDGVLVGSTVRYHSEEFQPVYLTYLEPDTGRSAPVTGDLFQPANKYAMVDFEGWTENGEAFVMWPEPTRGGFATVLHTISATRGVTRSEPVVRADDPSPLRPIAFVSTRQGRVTLTSSATIDRRDPITGIWHTIYTLPASARTGCLREVQSNILDLDEDGRGLVGFPGGPIYRVDLSVTPPRTEVFAPEVGLHACRSAYAKLDGGGELLALVESFTLGSGALGGLVWRADPSQTFTEIPLSLRANGAAVATLGDVAFVAVQSFVPNAETLAVLDLDRRRPDAGLRECATVRVGPDVRQLVRVGDRVVAAGIKGNYVAWIDVAER